MKPTIALLLLFSALSSSAQTLRTDVNLVSVFFTVRDNKGKLVTTLTQDAFKVTEDRQLLADKTQIITKNGRPDPPSDSRRPSIGGPSSRIPLPPTPMPKRTARLYDAIGSTVGKFLADEFGRKAIVIAALADDAG